MLHNMPVMFQRVENAVLAIAAAIAVVVLGFAWWWLPALFLLFDLSALGYLRSPRTGAIVYNLGHTYAVPVALGVVAALAQIDPLLLVALAWVFHIGVDRALGYGLKHPDAFGHTHLGVIGGARRADAGDHG